MTDYERLTRYMQVGNKVVQVIPQRKERIQAYIDRLFDLEDKIESGELISKKEVERLQAENAALRERLGKAIILPCKLGDKLYFVNKYLATPKIQEHYITAIEIFPSYVKLYVEDGGYFILDGDNVYFNPEAAKARLAELKGEEK